MTTKTNTLVLYSDENLKLTSPIHANFLIVHLGTPGPRVDIGEHQLTWDELELHGNGDWRIGRGPDSPMADLLNACRVLPKTICNCSAPRGHMSGCAFSEALRAVEHATAVVDAKADA